MPDAISDYFPAITKVVDEVIARDPVDKYWVDGYVAGRFRCFGRTIKDITLLPFYEIGQIPDVFVHLFYVVDAIAQLVKGIFHNSFIAGQQPQDRVDISRHAIDIVDNLIASALFPLIPIIQIFKDFIGIVAPETFALQKRSDIETQCNDAEHNSGELHKHNYTKLRSWLLKLRWNREISTAHADCLLRRHKELFYSAANPHQRRAFESSLQTLLRKEKGFNKIFNFLQSYNYNAPAENPNQRAGDLLTLINSDDWEQAKPQLENIFASLTQEPTRVYESNVPTLAELAFRKFLPIDAFLTALRSNEANTHQQLLKKINQMQWGLHFEKDEGKNLYVARVSSRVTHLDNVLLMLNIVVRKLDERFLLQIEHPTVSIDNLPKGPGISDKISGIYLEGLVRDSDIDLLAQSYPQGLLSLTLKIAYNLTDAGLTRIGQSFPNLREIEVNFGMRLTPANIQQFVQSLPSLVSIKFTDLIPMLLQPVQYAINNGRLKEHYSYFGIGTHQVGDECIAERVPVQFIANYYNHASIPQDKPRAIILRDCNYHTIAQTACHANTQKLEIRYSKRNRSITDQHVRDIADNSPNLRAFALENCVGVTSASLTHLVQHCTQLEEFEISINYDDRYLHDDIVTDALIDEIGQHCRNLKKLTIKFQGNVSVEAISRLVLNCTQLESLNLPGMNASSVVFTAIATHLPRLKELDLRFVSADNFNDSFENMLLKLKHLTSLYLNHIVKTLFKLHKMTHPHLNFYGVTDMEDLDELLFRLKACRELTTVSLVGNDRLMSRKSLAILKAAYPGVEFILE